MGCNCTCMKKEKRQVIGVGFTVSQLDTFKATQRKIGAATLAPVIARCAIIGLPEFQRMMNGGPEAGK